MSVCHCRCSLPAAACRCLGWTLTRPKSRPLTAAGAISNTSASPAFSGWSSAGKLLRRHGFQPGTRGRGRHHLRAHAAEQKPRARHFLHPQNRRSHCARTCSKGTLVVLESTTYPGTTDEDLRGVLEVGSELKAGTDFHLAFSPEREDPGNPDSKVALIPKVVGGYTPACLERRRRFMAGRSRPSCRFPPAAWPRPPNCWKTFSAA